MPAAEPVHVSVEAPEPPVNVVADNVQVRFVEFVVTLRLTGLLKPFRAVTVIEEVPAVPVTTVTVVGLALIIKSAAATAETW